MADSESSDTVAGTSNGVSTMDADKAAFLAGDRDMPAEKAEPKAPPADDDSDLDDEEKVETSDDEDLDEDDEAKDEDADLDEEDDKAEKPDADTSKRIAQVKRTDQRLRERREADFKARESSIQKVIDEWQPRIEKAEKNEALIARLKNPWEVGEVLAELGYTEDDFHPASQSTFARSKQFAADPKAKETVAKMKHDRERDERLAKLEKRDADREAADRQAAELADAEKRITAFVDDTTKATTAKTPLATALIEKNPARAKAVIADITGRLWDEHGAMPTPKQVIVALEKSRRQDLRDLGVDPKSITTVAEAKKATAGTDDKKPKKTEKTAPSAKVDDKKPLTKEDFVNRNFD